MTTISIQIPEGAEPGDTLEFQANGQSLELLVPMGSEPGDVLEIQVSASDDKHEKMDETNDFKNSGVIAIDIVGTYNRLELVSSLPLDHPARSDSNIDDGSSHDQKSDGTFALPWQSGVLLAESWKDIFGFLEKKNMPRTKRIVELGAGLGVVGISLAAAMTGSGNLIAHNSEIFLTDLPDALPVLAFNVEHNRSLLPSTAKIHLEPLRWELESVDIPSSMKTPYDLIVGSDILYNVEQLPSLVATMRRLLHPIRGVVILAVRWRKPELEREFFRTSGLIWELISSSPSTCPLSWRDFGNPKCEESNKFFHQTQVSLQKEGKPVSIGDISEEDAKNLPKEAFSAWEKSFIQFYFGRMQNEEI